ncbi:hypothetical protein FH609_002535 [Streptomyces sp. 3MP-14]|uniref:Uncharacterized protein n=1 Tax=Streptomyces mimosae TaxID=2586635 RepID=A0A5N6AF53_9ACTN|nr:MULTISPECIES: hypothetical protein [Streptomyces]KAB8166440.1 hypothetical protein FH607_011485 [Streptomyces mimosae]KAB8178869.1 hypothetical protein FH609_002535 [Streptomyces sp. 3MP-14]
MNIRGISLGDFSAITEEVSDRSYGGNVTVAGDAHPVRQRNAIVARLRVSDSRGQGARTSASGRHGPYACWHVVRDVLRQMFALAPDATVRTALQTYRGESGFLRDYPGTAYQNVGSGMHPAHMPDLCVTAGCGDQGAMSPRAPEENATPTQLDDNDVLARIERELRSVDRMPLPALAFEGPDSLQGVPDLAYLGR